MEAGSSGRDVDGGGAAGRSSGVGRGVEGLGGCGGGWKRGSGVLGKHFVAEVIKGVGERGNFCVSCVNAVRLLSLVVMKCVIAVGELFGGGGAFVDFCFEGSNSLVDLGGALYCDLTDFLL